MDNDYIIQLITKLDGSKTADDLKKIEQQLNAKGINLKTSLDTATSKQQLQELAKQLQSVLKASGLDIDTSKIMSAFSQVTKEADKLAQNVNKIQLQLDTEKYSKDIKSINDELAKIGNYTLSDKGNADIFAKAQKSEKSLLSTYDQLQKAMADNNLTDQQKIDIEKKYQQELNTTKNLLSQIKLSKDDELLTTGDSKRINMVATLNSYLAKNTAMTKENKKKIEEWIAILSSSDDMTVGAIKNINSEFKQLDATLRKTGQLGLSTWDKFKQAAEKFGGWSLVTGAITQLSSKVNESVTELKELDNILTEISKTSDLTENELKELGLSSYNTASKYGRTASDYLSGVQSMSQSGFYGEKGSAMAEQSLLAQAAGDMTQEVADKYILATNAAYKFDGEASKLNEVLDGQNSISNRNSVALKDMALAMSEAGTVASSYNVTVEDLSAMVGTIESVTKSGGSEVGNSIKSILVNLQNVTSDKITGTLDKANASMTEFVNGAEKLRNPIEILRDLAKTFNTLDEDDPLRAEIITNVGGKVCHVI